MGPSWLVEIHWARRSLPYVLAPQEAQGVQDTRTWVLAQTLPTPTLAMGVVGSKHGWGGSHTEDFLSQTLPHPYLHPPNQPSGDPTLNQACFLLISFPILLMRSKASESA